MRGLASLLLVVASATATARPASSNQIPAHSRRPPRSDDLMDSPFAPPPEPCASGKTWKLVETCLKKMDAKVIYDTPAVRVVQFVFGQSARGVTTRLWLYVPQNNKGAWRRLQYTGYTNAQTSLLGVVPFSSEVGVGVRLDMGYSARTTLAVAQSSVTRGFIRRVNTTVCVPSEWSCRSFMTACDAYVQGHLLWSFHSEIEWKTAIGLRLRGDTSHAGGLCTPIPSMIDDDL